MTLLYFYRFYIDHSGDNVSIYGYIDPLTCNDAISILSKQEKSTMINISIFSHELKECKYEDIIKIKKYSQDRMIIAYINETTVFYHDSILRKEKERPFSFHKDYDYLIVDEEDILKENDIMDYHSDFIIFYEKCPYSTYEHLIKNKEEYEDYFYRTSKIISQTTGSSFLHFGCSSETSNSSIYSYLINPSGKSIFEEHSHEFIHDIKIPHNRFPHTKSRLRIIHLVLFSLCFVSVIIVILGKDFISKFNYSTQTTNNLESKSKKSD
jgi:hypothetical protein